MFGLLSEEADASTGCSCRTERTGPELQIDASTCDGDGDLVSRPACRRTAIEAIGSRSVERVSVEDGGLVHVYDRDGTDVLRAAGRFAERVSRRDSRLASTARRDPVAAATEAAGRAGLVGDIAGETGLGAYADTEAAYQELLAPTVTPAIAASRIDPLPPPDSTLRTTRVLDSGATVRIYDRSDGRALYHLEPIEFTLDADAAEVLADAQAQLADPDDRGSFPGPYEAVETVANPETPVDTLARALEKHTAGYGVFEDLFSDEAVSEVFVNAPAGNNHLHVRTGSDELQTNVQLTETGAASLAARLRSETGRPFSRAAPTIDAAIDGIGNASSVRIAGVRAPASEGLAFALRAEGTEEWRLSRLVEVGTLSPEAAGLLSIAMARGAAILVAGPRGAGKTTMAAALLWELAPSTRLLAIEDTPELPVRALQEADRDAQRLEAATGPDAEMDPATALRTALRFGDGALAVGEVRGQEAGVLYEAMRVGAASDTVIGTIHGEGYEGVKERVVADLGVPASSFAATDLLVTLAPVEDGKQVTTIEEVSDSGAGTLFEFDGTDLTATPRLDRGNSRLVADLTLPGETYTETVAAIDDRAAALEPSPLREAGSDPAVPEPRYG